MPVTNFKISMNEYMRLVAEDAEKAENRSIYNKLLTDLSNFAAMMQDYFSVNKEGNAKVLDADDYKKLIDGYTTLAKDCNDFLSADHDKNRLENKRVNMIKKLSTCVGQDLRGLIAADRTKNLTLPDVMKESRTRIVDLTDKNLSRVGGSVSSRIALKSNTGTVGFFTKKDTFNFENSKAEMVNKLNKLLPEPFRGAFRDADKRAEFFDSLTLISDIDVQSEDPEKRNFAYTELASVVDELVPDQEDINVHYMLTQNPELALKLQEIQKAYAAIAPQQVVNQAAGIPDKSRLDQRNSAMSDVAMLLGMSGIIAKATPMKIIQGDKVIEGTFMERAVGEDINHLNQNSLMLQADANSFNNPAGLKQLADLQILDYICGNIDRHPGNIMYQFEKNGDKVVLTGICGIDNDASFGTKLFEDGYEGKEITPLSSIKNITRTCHEAIKNISLDILRVVLADKLSPAEVDAVCKRTELLKQKVALKEQNPEVDFNVVADDEWGKENYTYDKLTANQVGITNTIKTAINEINGKVEHIQSLPKESKELIYTDGKDVTNQAEANFHDIYSKLEGFVTRAGNLRSKLHVNSTEYNNMLRSLKTALDSGKDIKTALENQEDVNLDRFKDFARTVVELGISSQEYMSAKNLFQHTELGKDRFALATDMRNLAQEKFAIKEAAPEVKKPEAVKEPEPRMML